jgi:hypothetical protein
VTTKTRGRKAVDGATEATERVNIVLTREHRRRLEMLAQEGYSAWVRRAIDNAWVASETAPKERRTS